MNNGTGWPFGGPEVSIEEAATKAIFQTYEIEGGKEIEQDINVTDPKQQPYSVLSRVMAYDEKGKCINLTAHVKKRQAAMESTCRQMESDRSLHRKDTAESETGSSGRRRICDEPPVKESCQELSFPL